MLQFKKFVLNIQSLCNGDIFRPLSIDLFRYGKNGSHQQIGTISTSLDEIKGAQSLNFKSKDLYIYKILLDLIYHIYYVSINLILYQNTHF